MTAVSGGFPFGIEELIRCGNSCPKSWPLGQSKQTTPGGPSAPRVKGICLDTGAVNLTPLFTLITRVKLQVTSPSCSGLGNTPNVLRHGVLAHGQDLGIPASRLLLFPAQHTASWEPLPAGHEVPMAWVSSLGSWHQHWMGNGKESNVLSGNRAVFCSLAPGRGLQGWLGTSESPSQMPVWESSQPVWMLGAGKSLWKLSQPSW